MPLGLKKWLNLLATKPLPVLDTSLKALKLRMDNSQLALVDYARPILDDPALAMQLLKQANQNRQSSRRESLTTLSNALSHLGRGQLEQLLTQAQTLEQLGLPKQNMEGYRASLAAACHGAYLALDWAQQRSTHEPEEMQLAALLQFVAEMALWCHGGKVMLDIENRCYAQRLAYDRAAEQVLGCSIRSLGAELAKAWAQPELAVQSLEVKTQDYTLATGVMLAARFARLVQHSWHDQRAHQCLADIARYKGQSLSQIEPQIHQHAVALSDHFIELGFSPPARLLPMLVDEDYVDAKFLASDVLPQTTPSDQNTASPQAVARLNKQMADSHQPSAPATRAESPPSHESHLQEKQPEAQTLKKEAIRPASEQEKSHINPELAQKLAGIKTLVKQHVHAAELIQVVVDAIALSGFDRVVFAVKVPQKKSLHGRFFAQDKASQPFREFNISIAQPNLFSLLMNKSQCLWINDGNRGKFWNRVPDAVKLMLQNDSFMAMSIFTHKHSVGLMYADCGDGKLTQNEYKRFQGLCRLLVEGMVEISHHHSG